MIHDLFLLSMTQEEHPMSVLFSAWQRLPR
jgi:hypothetical protein